jgi:hypothetical protein
MKNIYCKSNDCTNFHLQKCRLTGKVEKRVPSHHETIFSKRNWSKAEGNDLKMT